MLFKTLYHRLHILTASWRSVLILLLLNTLQHLLNCLQSLIHFHVLWRYWGFSFRCLQWDLIVDITWGIISIAASTCWVPRNKRFHGLSSALENLFLREYWFYVHNIVVIEIWAFTSWNITSFLRRRLT